MPSVGYDVKIKFFGELDKVCVKKAFFKRFSTARERKYVGPPALLNFWSNSEVALQKVFNATESIKLENRISWSSYAPNQIMFSSYFLTSRTSRKLLRALKNNKDAVNYLSGRIYKDLNSVADHAIKLCGVKVDKRKVECHSFGKHKKYFKCVEQNL